MTKLTAARTRRLAPTITSRLGFGQRRDVTPLPPVNADPDEPDTEQFSLT
jgi:hypothetical protein